MDKIDFMESGKLRELVDAWVRGWHELSESRGFRNFRRRFMI